MGIKIITIDGPSASGKTTIARLLAKTLGYDLLESGKFYRFLTYALLEAHGKEKTINLIKNPIDLKEEIRKIFEKIKVNLSPSGTEIEFNGRLIQEELKKEEVEEMVSLVAKEKVVREEVNSILRKASYGRRIVTEGRDMGSVVFPEAEFKIFLTASEEERLKRRAKERGKSLKEVEILVIGRDKIDSTRKEAPLVIPEGAIVIDTTGKNPEEVLKEILQHLK